MDFEYNPEKSVSNALKHGIDFEQAKAVWNDPDYLEIPARVEGEKRFLAIGRIDGKHWSVVVTYRDGKVRIISARRARTEEITLYEDV